MNTMTETQTKKKRPRELIDGLVRELYRMYWEAPAENGCECPGILFDTALLSSDTDFLRNLADFRDGVREAWAKCPQHYVHDSGDPDLDAWFELSEWTRDHEHPVLAAEEVTQEIRQMETVTQEKKLPRELIDGLVKAARAWFLLTSRWNVGVAKNCQWNSASQSPSSRTSSSQSRCLS